MSLQLDTVFLDAIEADETIMQMIGGRRWCTSAAMPEEAFLENVDVPYVIVNYDGFSTDNESKDDPFDSGDDKVNIRITIAAKNMEQLGDLASHVRRAVHSYLLAHADDDGMPTGTTPSGGRKYYDEDKPCYVIDLTWQCDAYFDLNEDNDEQED